MNGKKITNKDLDAAMKNILRAAAADETDSGRVADNPFGFAAVRERIASEAAVAERPRRRMFVPAFSFASLLMALFVGAYVFSTGGDTQNAAAPPRVDAPQNLAAPAAVETSSEPVNATAVSYKPGNSKTAFRKRPARKLIRGPRNETRRAPSTPLTDTFYALNAGGTPDDEGGRVVRMNVTRASLFAMGVNVPLENESASVQADVVVDGDGVARAIRLVD
jgi:hypothetical protein